MPGCSVVHRSVGARKLSRHRFCPASTLPGATTLAKVGLPMAKSTSTSSVLPITTRVAEAPRDGSVAGAQASASAPKRRARAPCGSGPSLRARFSALDCLSAAASVAEAPV